MYNKIIDSKNNVFLNFKTIFFEINFFIFDKTFF